jgi:hypothetical protein
MCFLEFSLLAGVYNFSLYSGHTAYINRARILENIVTGTPLLPEASTRAVGFLDFWWASDNSIKQLIYINKACWKQALLYSLHKGPTLHKLLQK